MNGPGEAPLVSVLMPSYNHGQFVTQAIESVWAQTHPNIELLVVDDGSADNSVEVIRSLMARSPIPMFLETQPNAGPAAAFNRCLAIASGDWVCTLSSDDAYAPNFIATNLVEAAGYGNQDVVLHSNAFLMENSGYITGTHHEIAEAIPLEGEAFDILVEGRGRLLAPTLFLRRELLLRVGGFDPSMIAEDCDLQLRLARVARFHYVREPIFYSRYTPGSLGKKPWLWGEGIIRALTKHEDLLGSRLSDLLRRSSSNIAANCFEYGEWGQGFRWAHKTMSHANGVSAKVATGFSVAWRAARGIVRHLAQKWIGREQLVRAKRALLRQGRAAPRG